MGSLDQHPGTFFLGGGYGDPDCSVGSRAARISATGSLHVRYAMVCLVLWTITQSFATSHPSHPSVVRALTVRGFAHSAELNPDKSLSANSDQIAHPIVRARAALLAPEGIQVNKRTPDAADKT